MTEQDAADSTISAIRDVILKEYVDGTLAVKILIEPKDIQRFLKLLPGPGLQIAIVRLVEDHEKKPAPEAQVETHYGKQAQELRLHINWMGNPRVWAAFGTDAEYSEWCRNQPCAYCKVAPHWEMDTLVKSENAHVRRIANGAGEALKPPFSSIPLCHMDHAAQTEHGESAIGGKEFFDQQRINHVRAWLWEKMKQTFSIGSMRDLPPERLLAYAEAAELEKFLPDCYREVEQ